MADIKQAVKNNPLQAFAVGFSVFVTLSGVVISYFLLATVNQLAPLAKDIAVVKADLEANTERDTSEHSNFVTNSTFQGLETRLDHISNRLDAVYNIVANLKK